jgi:hypothetical protein
MSEIRSATHSWTESDWSKSVFISMILRNLVFTNEAFLIAERVVTHVITGSVVLNCSGQPRTCHWVRSTGSSTGYLYRRVESDVNVHLRKSEASRTCDLLHMLYALGLHAGFLRPLCDAFLTQDLIVQQCDFTLYMFNGR